MAVLSIYLSPFAPDYSGVASVLFDLNTVTAMHDASGCTGNYTGYDEPRWYGSKSPIFCSGLREIDAVLGDDEKLIKKMIHAAEDLNPELMALIGSPVPMVIGSDLVGVAAQLEERTGIPSLGFDTTGTAYYDKGVALATIALLKKFTKKADIISGSVNLVGATPLDFANGESLEDLRGLLKEKGYRITANLSMGYDMEQLKNAGSAQVNLAVSRAGFLIAEYMYKAYGIPYVCGLPIGKSAVEKVASALQKAASSGENIILKETPASHKKNKDKTDDREKEVEILIIGEQVQSNAIRLALEAEYGEKNITVGCLFGLEEKLAMPQDKNLSTERLIKEEVNKSNYHYIIADPFIEQLLSKNSTVAFYPNPQYAVSSKVCVEETLHLMGGKFNDWFQKKTKYKRGILT